MSNLCDGSTYIINLSNFIKSHEAQLANALLAYKKSSQQNEEGGNPQRKNSSHKPVRLSLTLHHLYFLLDNFCQINLKAGPLNIRLYDIDHDYALGYDSNASALGDVSYEQEYVSFLSNNYYNSKSKRLSNYSSSINSNDNSSITSISSMKSALSSMWNSISINNYGGLGSPYDSNITENPAIINHLKYLYSCFNKLPCLRLSPDSNSKLIRNYQEFPFDTIIPLTVFKNLFILEVNEINPKELFGWHTLAEILKFLIIKNADLNNKIDMVLIDLLWQDYNNRNHKLIHGNLGHNYTNSLPNSSPNSPIASNFANEKKKLTKKRHKSFANIRKKRNSTDVQNHSKKLYSHHSNGSMDSHVTSAKNGHSHLHIHNEYPHLGDQFYVNKWKNLKYLSFTNANLSCINNVKSFELLENLNSLDLSNNKFTEIPLSLRHLTNLKSLNLSDNHIQSLTNFKYFVIENGHATASNGITNGYSIDHIIDEFQRPKINSFAIKGLSLINLKNNQILDLGGIEFLKTLTKIDLSHNKIKHLKSLRALFLSGVEIELAQDADPAFAAVTVAEVKTPETNTPTKNTVKLEGLSYENLELLDELRNFYNVVLKPDTERAVLASLNLIGNPLQAFDKNYRIKLFNLCKTFGWVKCGIKINGSLPSYLETYYLINDSEFSSVDEIFSSTDSQLFLNFKKYLFDNNDYFHQFKAGDSIETFIQQNLLSEHVVSNGNVNHSSAINSGILKSISNYSLQIFAKDPVDDKKRRPSYMGDLDKENQEHANIESSDNSNGVKGSAARFSTLQAEQDLADGNVVGNYLVNSVSQMTIGNSENGDKREKKNFPKTFDTKPIPVNIQGNKLYLYDGMTRNNHGHAPSSSVKSLETTSALFGSLGNHHFSTTAISPTSVSIKHEDNEPIIHSSINMEEGNYQIFYGNDKSSDSNVKPFNKNNITFSNYDGTNSARPTRPNGMSTSRSLNNLLNLSQSLNVEPTKPTASKNFSSIRANTVFDTDYGKKDLKGKSVNRHERTKSAISYQSANTITE